ncbi:Yip1 family protein [Dyella amyloliquefaciens]|uniref:Yip1 family protein n=1 Tax=Dyella amyloliquefaciens TaxID=1770545 RepID=UPI00102E551A|nr:Yip1 family protein [Dyella amyloliquefaciens]
MDFGKIFSRIRAILATPQTEWPVIAAEPASTGGLFRNYIAIVAALPVIAHFIKGSLIGYGALGIHMHTPVAMGLVGMVLYYLLMLAVTYVTALIVNALAPAFGGQKDPVQALKVVAYAWTASWVGGIAVIIPWLGWLVALAGGIYSIYLIYLGLPHTMRCPVEKAGGYTAVTVIIAIVLSWIVALVLASVIGVAALSGTSMHQVQLDDGQGNKVSVDANSAIGKLAAIGQHAEQASKDLEAAQKSGDTAGQQAAMARMAGADGNVTSLPANVMEQFLPDTLAGMKRGHLSAERNGGMGVQVTTGRADYSDGQGHDIELEVTDTGNMRSMMAVASAVAPDSEQQTDHGYQKSYTSNGRLVHEAWDNNARNGEYSVVVAQRFAVKASGNPDSIDQLKQAVNGIDLDKLDSLKNEGVSSH